MPRTSARHEHEVLKRQVALTVDPHVVVNRRPLDLSYIAGRRHPDDRGQAGRSTPVMSHWPGLTPATRARVLRVLCDAGDVVPVPDPSQVNWGRGERIRRERGEKVRGRRKGWVRGSDLEVIDVSRSAKRRHCNPW